MYIDGCLTVCSGSTTVISSADPNGTAGEWRVVGAENVDNRGTEIEIEWGSAGLGSVEYIGGCFPQEICVNILAEPVADFTIAGISLADTITVCRDQQITWQSNSTGALSLDWSFGNGEVASTSVVTQSYDVAGFYTVIHTAQGPCDCGDVRSIVVEVLPAAAPTLDCISTVCPETRQVYTATTDGCSQFFWTVSAEGTIVRGGQVDDDFVEVIWHEGPDGLISLGVASCNSAYCSSSATFRVPVMTTDGPLQGDASVCSAELVTYSAPYFPGSQYIWTLDAHGTIVSGAGSSEITVLWDRVSSVQTATLTVSYDDCFLGCSGSDDLSVQIVPQIVLVGDRVVCQGSVASIRAEAGFGTVTAVPVDWELRNSDDAVVLTLGNSDAINPTINVAPGRYTWYAINNSGNYCNTIITQSLDVFAIPTAPTGIVTDDRVCLGQVHSMEVSPSGNFSTIWSIDDGGTNTTYTGATAQHSFVSGGPYSISATHADLVNPVCESSAVTVSLADMSDLSINGADTVCLYSTEAYSIASYGSATYMWSAAPEDMVEVTDAEGAEAGFFFSGVGDVMISLDICGHTIDYLVHVRDLPSFSVVGDLSTCGNVRSTISTDQPSAAHRWLDTAENVLGTSATIDLLPGSYGVEITDSYGCSQTDRFTIEALPYPEVNLTSTHIGAFCGVIDDGVLLVANTDGVDHTFEWFQDGTAIATGATYEATSFGIYRVETTNEFGCVTSSLPAIIEDCCPVDSCIVDGPAGCSFIGFDFMPTIAQGECPDRAYGVSAPEYELGSARWQIRSISEGRVASGSGDVFAHDYDLPGYYHVILRARVAGFPYDAATCNHFQVFLDSVLMVADFLSRDACAGDAVMFDDLTTLLPGETIADWSWDFGDPTSGVNNTSTDQNPSHVYDAEGVYTVTLTVTTASGCIDRRSHTVNISGGPTVSIEASTSGCEEVATGMSLSGIAYEVSWDFGDPSSAENTAEGTDVAHTYGASGSYTVTVTATDVYGCSSVISTSIDIMENNLAGVITATPAAEICDGDVITLAPPVGGMSWEWSTGETIENISVTDGDSYTVTLTDEHQCSYTTPPSLVTVHPLPEVEVMAREIFGPDDFGAWQSSLEICEGEDFEVRVFSDGSADTYIWNTGSTSSVLIFDGHVANHPVADDYSYEVVATDPTTTCEADPVAINVTIHALPDVPRIRLASGSACSFDDNVLEVTNVVSGLTYVWSDGQVGTTVTVSAAGDYSVEAINAMGCSVMSSSITVSESAPVDQLPVGCHQLCGPYTLCLPNFVGITSYTIRRNGVVFDSGTTWPGDIVLTEDGSYTYEITNASGCTATAGPLDVVLVAGKGVITTQVFVDVDGDGIISASDSLAGGIDLLVENDDASVLRGAPTENNGQFDMTDLEAGDYTAFIDRDLLSSQWLVLIDSVTVNIASCDDSVSVQLLITDNCRVIGPDREIQSCKDSIVAYIDSIWTSPGVYEYHHRSAADCDSVEQISLVVPPLVDLIIRVYLDIDGSGDVSAADELLGNQPWQIYDEISGNIDQVGMTPLSGESTLQLTRSDYIVLLDLALLDPSLTPVVDSMFIDTDACGPIHRNLLVSLDCRPVFFTESVTICPGDSALVYGEWVSISGRDTLVLPGVSRACDTTIYVDVTVSPPSVHGVDVLGICESPTGAATITLTPPDARGYSYQWSPDVSNGPVATELEAGEYVVRISDNSGCSYMDTITVDPGGELEFAIDPVIEIPVDGSARIFITGDTAATDLLVDWLPSTYLSCGDCWSPVVTPLDSAAYTIFITDASGCEYVLRTRVELTAPDGLFAANVFSPNQDGVNDIFRIDAADAGAVLTDLSIYNRSGALVYREQAVEVNAMQGWDGTYKSERLTSQVLVYTATIRLTDGQTLALASDLTLIR